MCVCVWVGAEGVVLIRTGDTTKVQHLTSGGHLFDTEEYMKYCLRGHSNCKSAYMYSTNQAEIEKYSLGVSFIPFV